MQKHASGIDLEKATANDITEYIETKMYLYELGGFTDSELWLLFKEDFEEFTDDNFRTARADIRTKLRSYLLRGGVWVATHSNKKGHHISDVLFDVVNREDDHE